jgi:hypothetical protein
VTPGRMWERVLRNVARPEGSAKLPGRRSPPPGPFR